MASVSTCQSREDGVEYLPAIQKLFGSFKGDAFKLRVLPFFFMYAMCDVLAKYHPGNGMIEHERLLLVEVIVVKQVISIRIKSIALEAFGQHLKRADASALFIVWMQDSAWQNKDLIWVETNIRWFSLRDARFKRAFRKCGEKSETSEHNRFFTNKTAGRGRPKRGPGLSILVFHRTSGNARRKYAANFGTLDHTALFM